VTANAIASSRPAGHDTAAVRPRASRLADVIRVKRGVKRIEADGPNLSDTMGLPEA
jgi:hypothetical protein